MGKGIFAPGLEEGDEFLAFFFGETGAHADVLQRSRIVVKAEEQRSDGGTLTFPVPAEAGDDAIAVALMFDLEHDALVRLVGSREGLGDDAVEACAFKATKPVERNVSIAGCRREMDGRGGRREQRFEAGAAVFEGLGTQIVCVFAEQIEEDERSGGLRSEEFDARGGRMNAQLQGIEVEAPVLRDDEFAVENAAGGQLRAKGVEEFGEIAIQGLLIAALEEDFAAVFEDEGAEAIPLRLEDPGAGGGDVVDAFGEHGQDGRIDGKVHG